ncbi:MAG: hypothetical protein SGILL_009860 [Bacillariaceae sp.]
MPTLIFRTFGSDLDGIASIISEFAQGRNPNYPKVHCSALVLPSSQLFQGRWKESVGQDGNAEIIYQLWNSEETKVVASGDEEILQLLATYSVVGIRDDYPHWKSKGYDPTAGKPVWVPSYDNTNNAETATYHHHILFDDNIHNLPHDGIACVRREATVDDSAATSTYETVPGDVLIEEEYQGVHLVRVPTIEPVLNPDWFLDAIEKAQVALQQKLRQYNRCDEGET